MSSSTKYLLTILIFMVTLSLVGFAEADSIDIQNEAVIINSTKVESLSDAGQATSNSVLTHTTDGGIQIHVRSQIGNEVFEYSTSTTLTPYSTSTNFGYKIVTSDSSVNNELDSDFQPYPYSMKTASATSLVKNFDHKWLSQTKTYSTPFVIQYFINLWKNI